jgi:uncharacterized membrane protein YhiD involved in acid resistance
MRCDGVAHPRGIVRRGSRQVFDSFFSSDSGASTRLFYFALLTVTVLYSTVSMIAPLITPVCDLPPDAKPAHRLLGQGLEGGLEDAPNPSYVPDPCRWIRYIVLLGMNKWEAQMSRRIVSSILMGSVVGFERRRADRPAGIRTMAMVCLGSCVFTLGSIWAFVDGTMGWDASRVSAAIPSGVGFLGAAAIWKGTKGQGENSVPEVHGLTTATSVWLSAAIGILCGGGLYVPGLFATFAGVVYLRFAPRGAAEKMYVSDEATSEQQADSTMRAATSMDNLRAMDTLREPLNPKAASSVGGSAPVGGSDARPMPVPLARVSNGFKVSESSTIHS